MEHWSFSNSFLPPGEPIKGKTYRADGWAYLDIPRMDPEIWKLFLDILSVEEYVLLAYSTGESKEHEKWIRGQILVSPVGWSNLETYSEGFK